MDYMTYLNLLALCSPVIVEISAWKNNSLTTTEITTSVKCTTIAHVNSTSIALGTLMFRRKPKMKAYYFRPIR